MSDSVKPRVLFVDDELDAARDLAILVADHLRCDVVPGPAECMHALRRTSYDLILLDIELDSEINGIDLLRAVKAHDPDLPAVMLTKSAKTGHIVESIKAGAFHYVTKGADPAVHDIIHVSKKAIEDARMRRAVSELEETEAGAAEAMVGSSPAMTKIRHEIARVAPLPCSVLITGESGSGKELVARAIHAASGRSARGRFVATNCAAIPEQLVESELFGHERGAFTGADRRMIGKFERAHGGTLFLDEIGDMTKATQAKVLRAIQEKEFERVGGSQTIEADVRVVAATNRDLGRLVEEEKFREELLFRINEYVVRVPPLRDRGEDVRQLAVHFVREAREEMNMPELSISEAALAHLCGRDWRRNNVRELRNAVRGAIVRSDWRVIQPGDFGYESTDFGSSVPPYDDAKNDAVEQFKRRYFTHLLRLTKGNITAAAEIAGIQRTALSRHLSQLRVDPKDFKEP